MKGKLDILVAKTKPFYFVSYNSEDASRVSSACKILQSLGMPLWCDNDVAYGERWEQVIGEKIDESTAVILFVTKGIFDKPRSYVRKEYDVAEFYEKHIYVVFLDTIPRSTIPHSFALWWSSLEKLQNCYISHFRSLEEAMEDFADRLGFGKRDDAETRDDNDITVRPRRMRLQAVHRALKECASMNIGVNGFTLFSTAGNYLSNIDPSFSFRDLGFRNMKEFMEHFPDIYEIGTLPTAPNIFTYRIIK